MRARRSGHIVNVTSIGGKVSFPHLLPYNSAKFAAVGFSEGLRAEVAGDGISVTTVVPGLMRTGSHLNASYKGEQRSREFTWFGLGASLPLVSMDARRAARRIVAAARRGQGELILTPLAQLGTRLEGAMPGTVSNLFGLVNRALPNAGEPAPATRGMDLAQELPDSLIEGWMGLGTSAARRNNEYPGPIDSMFVAARQSGNGHGTGTSLN
jgi:hypothetical protein